MLLIFIVSFLCYILWSRSVVEPGALKPSVGDGKESSRPQTCQKMIDSMLLVSFIRLVSVIAPIFGVYANQ